MKPYFLFLFILNVIGFQSMSQSKKSITHDVYDGWKSISERMISNDGKYIVYNVNPQEGDGELVIQQPATQYKKIIPRGYSAVISNDSRYLICKIKPVFQVLRQARIKKKKTDEMPKDSLCLVELGTDSVLYVGRVKSYKKPEKEGAWVAWQMEKPLPDTSKKTKALTPEQLKANQLEDFVDSIMHKALDSIKGKLEQADLEPILKKATREMLKKAKDGVADAEGDNAGGGSGGNEGTELQVKNLVNGQLKSYKRVTEYQFDKYGKHLLIETTKNGKDSTSMAYVLLLDLESGRTDTVMRRFNDSKNYVFDETGTQLAFVAERDSSEKALQKFYRLWHYKVGQDSAKLLADWYSKGIQIGMTVSENGALQFSKDARKLYFGVAPIRAPKDTNLVDFELARLDVWTYRDDYLQPQQLRQLDNELKRSYLAVAIPGTEGLVQLGDSSVENIQLVNEGNADYVLGTSTKGYRIQAQWTGNNLYDGYLISTIDGSRKPIIKRTFGFLQTSPMGRFVYWYDPEKRQYFTYEVATGIQRNISASFKVPLYNTENDVPDFPNEIGVTGWTDNDRMIIINDEFDLWLTDPEAKSAPVNITKGNGRKTQTVYTYVKTDPEKRFFYLTENMLLRSFNKNNKFGGFAQVDVAGVQGLTTMQEGPFSFSIPLKAKLDEQYIIQKSSIRSSELYATPNFKEWTALTDVASQQSPYHWLNVELVKWKMYDGKMSEGLLYKPENFDSTKKYPIIFYFYERNADGLYTYKTPAPSASTINIPYFVSNGYLVFDPNIYYKTGEPGQSAYNSVVSAARYLATSRKWVDSTRMGIQGQSWGGYQVAYLITKTNLFKAAGAGAPVSNMTSAYGGIRWGSGINRQFQYEKSQSRIGATLWERPDLYLKNSPLFAADKVKTPLLIMHNDADGAVPWYQGIEYFTALKRLGKAVWMLQYNNEDHNLVERKNRKDLSVRLQQFFDYHLKGIPPAKWLTEGVPAINKGRDWGL